MDRSWCSVDYHWRNVMMMVAMMVMVIMMMMPVMVVVHFNVMVMMVSPVEHMAQSVANGVSNSMMVMVVVVMMMTVDHDFRKSSNDVKSLRISRAVRK